MTLDIGDVSFSQYICGKAVKTVGSDNMVRLSVWALCHWQMTPEYLLCQLAVSPFSFSVCNNICIIYLINYP